ncbi:MAG: acetyl-CoA carboxylase biotin carboxylase subunit [Burkholderiaceae bacterium]|nr:acetyl-CoA carboxylase biotin carboxylase subunit [Burkholderiaceae bacterium]
MAAPLRRLLVANRGEIALRIIRSCRRLGIETVLASSSVDRDSLPARRADRTVCIGPGEAARSYLHIPSLIAAATGTGCDAVHPGYGFLAESEAFAQACEDAGLRFVGPTPTQIAAMGNKLRARELAQQCGLPLLPGSARVDSPEDASAAVAQIGFPVMLKAAAGGGGRGMKIVSEPSALAASFVAAAGEARAAFGDPSLYVERYVENARHVEVQVLGDGQGQVVQLGERDCSVQRRHQKLVEEAPAPGLSPTLRDQLRAAAVRLAASMSYRGAGTVEFLVDADREAFYFLEMNTRIQVEHPVTEMVTGIDLVAAQLGVAAHEPLGVEQGALRLEGHAIECRINAEDPAQGFRPSPGLITRWDVPGGPGVRLDSHCESGYRVPPHYDSLLGKLIVHAPTREAAVAGMRAALAEFGIEGVRTTLPFLDRVLADADFAAGRVNTRLVDRLLAA